MKRVDFFGVPGVGKSTVFHSLRTVRKSSQDFCFPEEARRLSIAKVLTNKSTLKHKLVGSLIKYKLLYDLFGKSPLLSRSSLKDAMMYFDDEYEGFLLSCALGVSHKIKDPCHLLLGAAWLANVIEEHYFFHSYLDDITKVIFDESLSQKVFGISDCLNLNDRIVIDYFNTMPLPQGVVLIEEGLSIIKSRLQKRSNILISHRFLSDEDLSLWIEKACTVVSIAKEVLLARKVKVLKLSALDEPINNAKKVREFICCL